MTYWWKIVLRIGASLDLHFSKQEISVLFSMVKVNYALLSSPENVDEIPILALFAERSKVNILFSIPQ